MKIPARQDKLSLLHAGFQHQVIRLIERLSYADIPLAVFETYRSPQRQDELYAQGRTRPGQIVTHARAWESFHQYGLAIDMAFKVDGQWTWDEPKPGMWKRYHMEARRVGLMPLDFETPHVQLSGYTSTQLRDRLPADGGRELHNLLRSAGYKGKIS